MKIAINTRFLLPNKLEGIGWYTYEIVKRLVQNHPEDDFIFFFDRAFDQQFIFGPNVTPIVLFPQARHPILWWYWFQISVKRALKKQQPDVFFSPDGYLSIGAQTPTVMVTHDLAHLHFPDQIPNLVARYYNHFIPQYLEHAQKVITISNYSKQDLFKHFDIQEQKVGVVYNGARAIFQPVAEETQEDIRHQYAEGQLYFFYVGSIHPRKNLERLLLAFEQFKQTDEANIKLLIAGRMAWQTSNIGTIFESLRAKEDIHFLGYVDDTTLALLMGAALGLVYVSLFEGFGLPLVEAMQCQIPIITASNSALGEVSGEAALKVDPTSIDAIALAMQRIAKEPMLRQDLITKGKKRRTLFNWDKASEEVYSCLLEVAQAKKKNAP